MSAPNDPSTGNGPPPPPEPGSGTSGGWGPADGRPPGYGPSGYGRPGSGQPPQQGQPASGQPGYGQPGHGQPQYGQPGYGQPQPQYGQPQYGQPQYGQPQYGRPQYGQGAGPGGAPSGYRPAPVQPGVVPLRPLSMGEIFDGAFRSVRANPRVMFGFTALVVSVAVALGTLFQWLLLPSLGGAFSEVGSAVDPTGAAGLVDSLGVAASTVAMLPWTTVATAVLTGVLTVSVSRSVIGQRMSVGELWRSSWKHVLLLVAYTVVFGLVALAVFAAWVAGLVALATAEMWGGAAALGLGGGLVLLVGGAWILVRLLFVPPAMVLERTGLRSIPRAWRLSRGSFWRIFGIYLLTSIIVSFVAQIIVTPFTLVATFMMQGAGGGVDTGILLTNLGTALASILTIVFTAAVVALLYIDVRIRREGLDVELARAAETAGAG